MWYPFWKLIPLYPLILSRFTMCLKFQLTKTSEWQIVAIAMCWQSARLVLPTTFASMYLSARRVASGESLILSTLAIGKLSSNSLTNIGALNSSASRRSEIITVIPPALTVSKKGMVSVENSSSKYPPTTDVSIYTLFFIQTNIRLLRRSIQPKMLVYNA